MQCAKSAISRCAQTLLAVFATALAGCGVTRPSDFAPVCPSYEASIRPLLEAQCSQCHSVARAEGDYQVGEYTQTVSRDVRGVARVAPGEASSPFLAAVRGELTGHTPLDATDLKALQHWVIVCRAAPLPHEFHPKGWATPTDTEQSHGAALRANFYNFSQCQHCHGEDFRGGASKVDCNSCHLKGPLECNTCHGDETSPAPGRDLNGTRATENIGVGAHRAHVTDGPAHKAFGCASCHLDVKSATDEGHYRRAGVFSSGPAQVQLASGPGGLARWDRNTATCSNSACHAPSATDTAPTRKDPVWTRVGKGEGSCGSCHGAPPSSHTDNRCELCHGAAYADGGVDLALHLNGQLELRNGGQRCNSCHADSTSATFVDLKGRGVDAGVRTVGAHDAHLNARALRGPLSCNECHRVPNTLLAVGHLDSTGPAEVFPADEGGLAWKHNSVPTYNAANATCSNYCHSVGEAGRFDTAPTLLRLPSWTGGSDQAACGTCHGLPPQDGTVGHNAAASLACNVCHSGTVDADGGLIFSSLPDGGLTSKHLDGTITGQ